MRVSDDRWSCPDCGRTFVVQDPLEPARPQLEMLRTTHAAEHVDDRQAPNPLVEIRDRRLRLRARLARR